jgi:hypothetical protein
MMSPRRNYPERDRSRRKRRGSGAPYNPDYVARHARSDKPLRSVPPPRTPDPAEGCQCCDAGPLFFTPAASGHEGVKAGDCVNCFHGPSPHGVNGKGNL